MNILQVNKTGGPDMPLVYILIEFWPLVKKRANINAGPVFRFFKKRIKKNRKKPAREKSLTQTESAKLLKKDKNSLLPP
jgi:hypothetical protein